MTTNIFVGIKIGSCFLYFERVENKLKRDFNPIFINSNKGRRLIV